VWLGCRTRADHHLQQKKVSTVSEVTVNDGVEEQAEDWSPEVSNAFNGLSLGPIRSIYDNRTIPSSLFHYTSSQGLLGIIGGDKLWFSDASFMNDGSEATWGADLASAVIEEFLAGRSAEERAAGDALRLEIPRALAAFQPIIFCMSARNNLLNQWRDYGKDIVPYSIELDTRSFETGADPSFKIFITKIVYDMELQRKLMMDLLTLIHGKTIELLGQRTEFGEEEGERLVRGAAVEVVNLVSRFKNTSFEAEEEWRAIAYSGYVPPTSRKFRASGLGVVPYYEWSLKDQKLPIKSVTVGPSPYATVSDLALKQFLQDSQYDVPTRFSLIPIRRS
jgi:hypothetical protein